MRERRKKIHFLCRGESLRFHQIPVFCATWKRSIPRNSCSCNLKLRDATQFPFSVQLESARFHLIPVFCITWKHSIPPNSRFLRNLKAQDSTKFPFSRQLESTRFHQIPVFCAARKRTTQKVRWIDSLFYFFYGELMHNSWFSALFVSRCTEKKELKETERTKERVTRTQRRDKWP